ncbi:MAG: hypothetical protein Q4G43_03945 [Mobilicoccus sp.]|nr:hypothetical protein [Mobilicoccus sp.]
MPAPTTSTLVPITAGQYRRARRRLPARLTAALLALVLAAMTSCGQPQTVQSGQSTEASSTAGTWIIEPVEPAAEATRRSLDGLSIASADEVAALIDAAASAPAPDLGEGEFWYSSSQAFEVRAAANGPDGTPSSTVVRDVWSRPEQAWVRRRPAGGDTGAGVMTAESPIRIGTVGSPDVPEEASAIPAWFTQQPDDAHVFRQG